MAPAYAAFVPRLPHQSTVSTQRSFPAQPIRANHPAARLSGTNINAYDQPSSDSLLFLSTMLLTNFLGNVTSSMWMLGKVRWIQQSWQLDYARIRKVKRTGQFWSDAGLEAL